MQVGPKFYQWQAAPFVLSNLHFSFSIADENCAAKVERPRDFGVGLPGRHFGGLIQRKALQKHKEIVQTVLQDLTTLGLIVNCKKSILNPSQQVDYLGFHLDFVEGKLKVPQHKLRTVKKSWES